MRAIGLLLLYFISVSEQLAIDNGIAKFTPICGVDDVRLEVTTLKQLQQPARVFVKGRSNDPACGKTVSPSFTQNISFSIPLGLCGMERSGRQGTLTGASYTITYIVSFHHIFLTKVDQAFKIICNYGRQIPPQDLTAALSVSMLPTEVPLNQDLGPICSYRIHSNTSHAPFKYARIGDKVIHEWTCSNLNSYQYIWVRNCSVSPEYGDGVPVISSSGCSLDPIILSNLEYASDAHSATASHHAYKFADHPTLLFKCQITICDSRLSPDLRQCPSLPLVCGTLRPIPPPAPILPPPTPQGAIYSGNSTNRRRRIQKRDREAFDVVSTPIIVLGKEEELPPVLEETEEALVLTKSEGVCIRKEWVGIWATATIALFFFAALIPVCFTQRQILQKFAKK